MGSHILYHPYPSPLFPPQRFSLFTAFLEQFVFFSMDSFFISYYFFVLFLVIYFFSSLYGAWFVDQFFHSHSAVRWITPVIYFYLHVAHIHRIRFLCFFPSPQRLLYYYSPRRYLR